MAGRGAFVLCYGLTDGSEGTEHGTNNADSAFARRSPDLAANFCCGYELFGLTGTDFLLSTQTPITSITSTRSKPLVIMTIIKPSDEVPIAIVETTTTSGSSTVVQTLPNSTTATIPESSTPLPGLQQSSQPSQSSDITYSTKVGLGVGLAFGSLLVLAVVFCGWWFITTKLRNTRKAIAVTTEPGVAIDTSGEAGVALDKDQEPGIAVEQTRNAGLFIR